MGLAVGVQVNLAPSFELSVLWRHGLQHAGYITGSLNVTSSVGSPVKKLNLNSFGIGSCEVHCSCKNVPGGHFLHVVKRCVLLSRKIYSPSVMPFSFQSYLSLVLSTYSFDGHVLQEVIPVLS